MSTTFSCQDNDHNGSDVENRVPQNKRKREDDNEETVGDESIAKKTRLRSNSSEGTCEIDLVLT